MKMIVAIAGFVIMIIWDFTQNDGHMTRSVITTFVHFTRSMGY